MPTTDLGPVIYERKEAAGLWFAIGWPLAALLGAAGVFLLERDVTLTTVLWGAAGLALLVPLFLPGRTLRFHETALVDARPLRAPVVLPYERVEHMTWQQVDPQVGLTVRADLRGAGRRIAFMVRMDRASRTVQALDAVRDRIAHGIAAGWHARLAADQPVAWTKTREAVRLRRDGLAYRPVGFFGAGDERFVPWTTPLEYAFYNGFLTVRPTTETEALFTLPCAGPDFYPGFSVFASMSGTAR